MPSHLTSMAPNMTKSNAIMAMSSFDRSSGSFGSATTQPYNNFRIQTQGGNIIQGSVNRLRVSEIMFPYQIPTIIGVGDNAGTGGNNAVNSLLTIVFYQTTAVASGSAPTIVQKVLILRIPTGYYTAAEMETEVQGQIDTFEAAQSPVIPPGTLTVALDATSQAFVFRNNDVWNSDIGVTNYLINVSMLSGSANNQKALQQPNLAWILGLRQIAGQYPPQLPVNGGLGGRVGPVLVPEGYPNDGTSGGTYPVFAPGYGPNVMVGSTYAGRYTDYIDVCSTSLCQAQYVRDGNTNQAIIRRDQICRLYVSNEISVYNTDPDGTRPFTIHRQYYNAKVMKWTAERSIDAIDIQLFDMFGNPLPIPNLAPVALTGADYAINNGPGNFAITFLVEENESEMVSNDSDGMNVGYRF